MSLAMFRAKYSAILVKKPLAVQESARQFIAEKTERARFLNSLAPEMRVAFEDVIAAEDALEAALAKVNEINDRTAAQVTEPEPYVHVIHEVVLDEAHETREQAARTQRELEAMEAYDRRGTAMFAGIRVD
jgi:hypothetical protein